MVLKVLQTYFYNHLIRTNTVIEIFQTVIKKCSNSIEH